MAEYSDNEYNPRQNYREGAAPGGQYPAGAGRPYPAGRTPQGQAAGGYQGHNGQAPAPGERPRGMQNPSQQGSQQGLAGAYNRNNQAYGGGRPQGGMPPRQGLPAGQGAPRQGMSQGQYPQAGMPPRPGMPGATAGMRGGQAPQGAPRPGMNPQQGGPRPGAQNRGQAYGGMPGQPRPQGYGQDAPRPGAPGQQWQGAPRQGMPGARGSNGQAQYGRARGGNPNVQLVDSAGQKRLGSTSNAGAYTKEYGNAKPKVFRIVIIAIIALVAALLIFGGIKIASIFSNMYASNKFDKEQQEQLDSVLAEARATEPFFMLLMGTDASQERVEVYKYNNNLSDTMMLVRVDAPNKKVTIISLLRDTWVNTAEWSEETWNLVDPKFLPYIGAEIKLNSATTYCSSPALLIACIKQLTGVEVAHYASIDMDGFISLVDKVGGIEVDIPVDLYDEVLNVEFKAGRQTLTGAQALDLCRMRHAYEQGNTEYGHGGDIYRAANQRMVVSAILKKVLASDLGTLSASVIALSQYVTIDNGFSVTDLANLAMAFKGLNTATDIYSTRIPTKGGYMDTEAWQTMVSRMSQGLSPVTEDVVDPLSGTILQSAGTGTIQGLTEIDDSVNSQLPSEEGAGEGSSGEKAPAE